MAFSTIILHFDNALLTSLAFSFPGICKLISPHSPSLTCPQCRALQMIVLSVMMLIYYDDWLSSIEFHFNVGVIKV